MKIWSKNISNLNLGTVNKENLKLTSVHDNFIIIEIKYEKSIFRKIYLEYTFDKYAFFEIHNGSLLWSYDFEHINNMLYININLETELVHDFINKSVALNILFSNEFSKLPNFDKFDDNKSYVVYGDSVEPPSSFQIKLFDYQKKSLAKMIKMEKKEISFKIEYTPEINFKNIMNIKFDPFKNTKSSVNKYFNITSNGGILADEMGLGKTITSLSLIATNPFTSNQRFKYSNNQAYWKLTSKATLVVCPSHISKQWESEAKRANPSFKILSILTKRDHEKLFFKDFIEADIIIISQQFLMNFKYYPELYYKRITPAYYNPVHRNNTLKEYFTTNILNTPNNDNDIYEVIKAHECPLFEFFYFHRLILDEGHEIFGEMLSNHSLSRYMSTWLNTIDANSYWFVSGSPFINYTGLINCIKYLNLTLNDTGANIELNFHSRTECCLFENILTKKYLWNNILNEICIRHRKSDLTDEIQLFGYDEKIEWVEFTELESKLYESKKSKLSKENLQQLCCHPFLLDSCRKVFGDIDTDLSVMQTKLIEYHIKTIETYTSKIEKLDTTNQAYHMVKKSFENIIAESNYMLSVLNKLANTELNDESENNCSICLEDITDGSVTTCGHIYCSECIKNCLKYKMLCPMCKKPLTHKDVFLLNKKNNEKPQESLVNPLVEKYGSKLGKIISMIRNIVLEPDSRIIIFSQWDFMLTLIGKTLSENGIANCFVKGNVWSRTSAISKFKNGKTLCGEDNKVIMLSLKNAASGTNLTEASHIFFVEPINASKEEAKAIEGQAIGRACRLGQKRKVQLFRILLKNTIEEEIYDSIYKSDITV